MIPRRIIPLLLVILGISSLAWSRDKGASASDQRVYRNFLGNWEGSSERIVDGQLVVETVDIVITEVPNKHLMQLDYLYKGKNGEKKRRFLELDPAKQMMKMYFKGDSIEEYGVSGLEQFEQIGLGDFAAVRSTTKAGSKNEMTRVTFHLGVDTLNYEWASATDGLTYKTYSKFSFKRRPSLGSVAK